MFGSILVEGFKPAYFSTYFGFTKGLMLGFLKCLKYIGLITHQIFVPIHG
jgi:hypothetical protein